MSIIKYRAETLAADLGAATPVAVPIGEPVSQVRSRSLTSDACATTRTGLWKCSPGRWVRQVSSAEFCHFLEGECVFEPESGEPIHIVAGDVLYFPANSRGVWDVITASTKVFVVFAEP